MLNRNYLNIDVYIKDGVLCTRLDTSILVLEFAQSNHAERMLNKINQPDLMALAKRFAEQSMTYSDYANKTIMASKHITERLLTISCKNLDNSFQGESTIKSTPPIMLNPVTILTGKHVTIIYRISNIPHVMINWVAFFSIYMNHIIEANLIHHIQFEDYSYFDNLSGTTLTSINDLYSGENCKQSDSNVMFLMKKMLDFKKNLTDYQDALHDLGKVYKAYESSRNDDNEPKKPLIQCLFDSTRAELVYDKQVKEFSSSKDNQPKESHFLSWTIANKTRNKRLECLFMLETINASAKINLIMPCLGEIAHDQGRYNMSYTEIGVIYFAEFYLFPNGTMGIINLDQNSAYLKHYAVGRLNHAILSEELEHLANILDLELAPDCDYHKDKQILFTPACSIKLANLGLHLNGNYSKKLLHAYQTWFFFTTLQLARDENVFSKLPHELLDNIIIETNPSYKSMYNNKLYPGFYQAVQRGRQEAIQERTTPKSQCNLS